MPKIEVNEKLFFKMLGKKYDYVKFEELLTSAKAELDETPDEKAKEDERVIKIELNDTNRPDLWSTAGLSRALRIHRGEKSNSKNYEKFLSTKKDIKDSGKRLIKVSKDLKDIRPFVLAFAVTGKAVDEPMLKDIIQTQEKLCNNFGRKRKSIAMGVYRSDLLSWPVHYEACDPNKTKFKPLDGEKEMTCREILKEHPKGVEYAHILEGKKNFPLLKDDKGEILSMPPIINSDKIGAVKVGDENLLVEFTGTDIISMMITANIVACDFTDCGFTVLPVKVEYPYDTEFGREITAPYYFQEPCETTVEAVNKLLGSEFKAKEIAEALQRMDCETEISGNKIKLIPPAYRNDFLHEVDIIEDVMLGKTVPFFEPKTPNQFTIGRLMPITELSRKVKSLMVGMGYQEMIFNYLGSKKDQIERMCIDGKDVIEISNPMSENYQFVRISILPALLNAEMNCANAVYPHKIFEIGKTAFLDESVDEGTRTIQSLGFLTAVQDANFNDIAGEVASLMYYMKSEYKVVETDDPRFIKGRQVGIMHNGKQIGIFGEISPQVLENWNITIPCCGGEMNLEEFLF